MTERIGSRYETLFSPLRWYGARYFALVFGLLAVVGWGVYAYFVQFTTGLGVTGMRNETSWGFYIINFIFLIGISHAGTLISAILRVANAEWRRPITRMAESITVMSIVVALLFPVIDLGRPDRLVFAFTFARLQSPLTWDFLCIGTYLIGSTIYLYLPLIPDIAVCRDNVSEASRLRRWFYKTLSLGWSGTREQEDKLKHAIKIMAVLIIPIAISVHSIVSWDFAMTLRVEWHSTIFAPYFVGGAIFSGIATIIIMMAVFRKVFHLEEFISHKHFVYLALMMFALNLAMIYMTISKDLVATYMGETVDLTYLTMLFSGQFASLFWFQIIGGLVVPAVLVAVPRTRRSLKWLVFAAILVDVGMWVERFLLVTPALATPQLPYDVGQYLPSWVEISIVAAGFAGFVLLLAIFARIFPVLSLWEMKEGESLALTEKMTVDVFHADAPQIRTVRSNNQSLSRRTFLKHAALSGVGLVAGVAVAPLLGNLSSPQRSGVGGTDMVANPVPLLNLGESVTLVGAREGASFQVMTPSGLPDGSEIKDVRLAVGGGLVTFLYRNPNLESLSIYGEDVAIAVYESQDNVISSAPAYLPAGFVRLNLGGNQGFARESLTNRSGVVEPGQVQWWAKGLRYSIFANLPIQDLKEIASSKWLP